MKFKIFKSDGTLFTDGKRKIEEVLIELEKIEIIPHFVSSRSIYLKLCDGTVYTTTILNEYFDDHIFDVDKLESKYEGSIITEFDDIIFSEIQINVDNTYNS